MNGVFEVIDENVMMFLHPLYQHLLFLNSKSIKKNKKTLQADLKLQHAADKCVAI